MAKSRILDATNIPTPKINIINPATIPKVSFLILPRNMKKTPTNKKRIASINNIIPIMPIVVSFKTSVIFV